MLARYLTLILGEVRWSWFWKLRNLFLQYLLPHPLCWLQSPPEKDNFRKLCKSAVLNFWRRKLSLEVQNLSSLRFLKPDFISLTSCHPIYASCGSNTYEVAKAVVVGRLLSGRFKFERLERYYTPSNSLGQCRLPKCWGSDLSHDGDLESFLLACPSLNCQRLEQMQLIEKFCDHNPHLSDVIQTCMTEDKLQFLMDCSVMSPVILAVQQNGQGALFKLLKLTRNFIFSLFTTRNKLLETLLP